MTSLYAYFDVFNDNFSHYQVLITPPHFETGGSFSFSRLSPSLSLSQCGSRCYRFLLSLLYSSTLSVALSLSLTLSTRSFADFLSVRPRQQKRYSDNWATRVYGRANTQHRRHMMVLNSQAFGTRYEANHDGWQYVRMSVHVSF